MLYTVQIYNFVNRKWDIMEFTDYGVDDKKKDAIHLTKRKAERLNGFAICLSGRHIKTRVVKEKGKNEQ